MFEGHPDGLLQASVCRFVLVVEKHPKTVPQRRADTDPQQTVGARQPPKPGEGGSRGDGVAAEPERQLGLDQQVSDLVDRRSAALDHLAAGRERGERLLGPPRRGQQVGLDAPCEIGADRSPPLDLLEGGQRVVDASRDEEPLDVPWRIHEPPPGRASGRQRQVHPTETQMDSPQHAVVHVASEGDGHVGVANAVGVPSPGNGRRTRAPRPGRARPAPVCRRRHGRSGSSTS